MRSHDLARHLEDIIAAATQSQLIWRKEPVTLAEVAVIRLEVLRYLTEVIAELEKQEKREKEAEKAGVRA